MQVEKKQLLKRLLNVRIVAVIGILALVVSYLSFSGENPKKFTDVKDNHWAYDEISFLTDKGIISGYPDGTFKLNQSISRLQAVMMILREQGVTDFSNVKNPGFIDIQPGDYGYEIMAKAVELGIIDGKTNTEGQKYFDASGNLTRAQMAKILANAYDLEGNGNVNYSDVPKSHWAYTAIQSLAQNQIAYGYGNGKYGTNDSLTRTQFSAMLARILDESFRSPIPTEPTASTESTEPIELTEPTEPTEPTGNVYPDGWVSPVLESAWSPNHATNLATLQNELGFTDGGSQYGVPGKDMIIQVIGQSPSDPYEVTLAFYMWEDSGLPESYRVPVVARELFKLYFGADANRVWTYFDNNLIPVNFTANGRNMEISEDIHAGGLQLHIGRK